MQTTNMQQGGLLLDTHIWIWLFNGSAELADKNIKLIEDQASQSRIFISAISVWEIATLFAKRRIILRSAIREWIDEALSQPGVDLLPLSPEISIESTQLPDGMHGDPADRLIVATARIKRLTLATRDAEILSYAKSGYIRAIKM